jgi:hypothetical protein
LVETGSPHPVSQLKGKPIKIFDSDYVDELKGWLVLIFEILTGQKPLPASSG